LIIFNFFRILIVQEDNLQEQGIDKLPTTTKTQSSDTQYPDIYYLIFDEAAGFEVMRQYWDYYGVDKVVEFLESNGFFVAENSHSGSIETLREIATRLNYTEYPAGGEYFPLHVDAISDNRVMNFLKTQGYTLVGYDERRTPYPTIDPMPVDYLVEKPPDLLGNSSISFMDDFKFLVFQNTIFRPLISVEPETRSHLNMILYTTEVVATQEVKSPKFVYVHLMLPHSPFAFTEIGGVVPNQAEYFNWQRYLENYKFFLQVMRLMVINISTSVSGDNPPVIILQSDHGARNQSIRPYSGILENYQEDYKAWIVNAIFLPNCADAPLTQDMDPINTFPIVFNCYFDADIPLK
jgi:hypothetical protein